MTSDPNKSIGNPKQAIKSLEEKKYDEKLLFKSAYEREKTARKETEEILEEKTLELYAANNELRHSNDLLRRQQKNMVKTEKMVALGQLSAGVAHEINNPLAFVISNIGSLERYVKSYKALSEKYAESASDEELMWFKKQDFTYINNDSRLIFNEVKEGLERVRDIVANLKSFSRTQSADREQVNVDDLIQSALKIAHNQLKYHCKVELGLAPTPDIYCNANELVQVFLNLIVNAAQAIKDSGIVSLSSYATEDHIIVEVKDTGCGIPEENLTKIFDPFFTAKPLGQGTGLGLSVSYGIVKDLDGTISVDSVEGEGTTFSVLLPIEQRAFDRDA